MDLKEKVDDQNLSDQATDKEDSVDECEFQQAYPNLTHIIKIVDESGKVIAEKSSQINPSIDIQFENVSLNIECKPPSKGHIRYYQDDWMNVFENEVGIYCKIKNTSQETDIELEMFDTPNEDTIKRENVPYQKDFIVNSICDNDYLTRDWETIYLYANNKKYTIIPLIKNPFTD